MLSIDSKRHWWAIFLCGGVWFYSVCHFLSTGVFLALRNFYGDFLANFPAPTIAAWVNRSDFYIGSLANLWFTPPRWGYAPIAHVVTLPLFLFRSLHDAYQIWLYINYGFLIAASILLYRLTFSEKKLLFVTAFGFIMLNYYPLYEALLQRNIEIFEFLLLVVAMSCYSKNRDIEAGVMIGLAAMTKFLPGIFVPYFAMKKRWKAFWASILVILITALITQLTLGWQNNWILIQLLDKGYMVGQTNQSVTGLIMRLMYMTGSMKYCEEICSVTLMVLIVALGWFMFRFRSHKNWQLEWSLLIIGMVMILPHNENYYLIFLLIPYAVLLVMILKGYIKDFSTKALFAASFFLTGWPLPLSLLDPFFGQTGIVGQPTGKFGHSAAEQLLFLSVPVWGVLPLVFVLVRLFKETWPTEILSNNSRK